MEFCHNVKPFVQPLPHKNPGGDCFACALTAVLCFLFPENPPEFDRVWEYFLQQYYNSNKKGISNSWPGIRQALYNAKSDGYEIDIHCDMVKPEFDIEHNSHSWWMFTPGREYALRLEGWLRGGWVAITEIDNHGRGPCLPDGKSNRINHVVLLDGVRIVTEWEEREGIGPVGVEKYYIHVVNSSRAGEHAYWIEQKELLEKYGATAWWLVRREG